MRQKTITLYTFDELDDSAKERAIEHFRNTGDVFAWSDDWRASIEAFCEHFGVKLTDWSVGPFAPIDYKTDVQPSNFRGLKLKNVSPDTSPTGFCGDNDLFVTFHDWFTRTGDAHYAFGEAIYAGFKAWRDDWEHAYSDEAIEDFITCNEYEFTEEGELS